MILYLFYHLMLIANLLITPKNVVPHKNYIPRLNTIQVSLYNSWLRPLHLWVCGWGRGRQIVRSAAHATAYRAEPRPVFIICTLYTCIYIHVRTVQYIRKRWINSTACTDQLNLAASWPVGSSTVDF